MKPTSRLGNVGYRYKARYKLLNGAEFFGQLLAVPPTPRVVDFLNAARLLRTGPNSPLVPGNVVICNNSQYIVGEHGEGVAINPIYMQFKLFEVTDVLPWNAQQTTTNQVTGISSITRTAYQDDAYLSMQVAPDISDQLNVDQQTRIAVSSVPAQVDDAIGSYIVMRSYQLYGVTILHLKQV